MLRRFLNSLYTLRKQTFDPTFVGRQRTCDVAFQFRMGAGFPGDVNRTHPASIEPVLIDASAPPTIYGQPLLVDPTTQGVRPITTSDQSDSTPLVVYGALVRPYPTQQTTGGLSAALGAATPPTSGPADALRLGYIMGQLGGTVAAVKNAAVYVWATASSGTHVQGGYEAAASAGNTVKLANATFNGGADANGVVEVIFGLNYQS